MFNHSITELMIPNKSKRALRPSVGDRLPALRMTGSRELRKVRDEIQSIEQRIEGLQKEQAALSAYLQQDESDIHVAAACSFRVEEIANILDFLNGDF